MIPPMRRKSREFSSEETISLLQQADFGVLSTIDEENQPYGTPLSYVLNNNFIYFHCALKGAKINNMRHNSKVCFTVVGERKPVFEDGDFSTFYKSAMVFGIAEEIISVQEKEDALTALCMKYMPELAHEIENSIAKEMLATSVWRISMDTVAGKSKRK